MLKRALPSATKAQKSRWDTMREIGCVVARLRGLGFVPGEIHHLTVCGRTISHDDTICLNPWSHRGVVFDGWTRMRCEQVFGPSLARGSKPFHAHFGSDDELLAEQERLLLRYGFKEAA